MTSQVAIANLALSHLGNRARVASIYPPDGSVEADLCSTFFPLARDELLELADWSFARKRLTLAEMPANDSELWAHAYALPSDCLRPRRMISDNMTLAEEDSASFIVEGQTIFTNKQNARLIYTRYMTDVSQFPPSVVTTFSYLLAAHLAGPIIKNDAGAQAAVSLRKVAKEAAAVAVASDANGSKLALQPYPSSLAARHGVNPLAQAPVDGFVLPGSGYAIT